MPTIRVLTSNTGHTFIEVTTFKKYTFKTNNWKINEVYQLNVSERWVVFKFKDYAVGGKTSVKTMGLFTFIEYLIQHIPDKFFRLVRALLNKFNTSNI